MDTRDHVFSRRIKPIIYNYIEQYVMLCYCQTTPPTLQIMRRVARARLSRTSAPRSRLMTSWTAKGALGPDDAGYRQGVQLL